jgi:hypothetical protein
VPDENLVVNAVEMIRTQRMTKPIGGQRRAVHHPIIPMAGLVVGIPVQGIIRYSIITDISRRGVLPS